jgi:hypothetical protein
VREPTGESAAAESPGVDDCRLDRSHSRLGHAVYPHVQPDSYHGGLSDLSVACDLGFWSSNGDCPGFS